MSPSVNHSYIQSMLIVALSSLKQYSVFSELSIEIEGKEYVPDISVYKKRRFIPFQDVVRMTEMPLLAIEILSPSQVIQDLTDKIGIYLNAGVQSCWLVIPTTCTVAVCSDLEKVNSYGQGQLIDEKLDIKLELKDIFRID